MATLSIRTGIQFHVENVEVSAEVRFLQSKLGRYAAFVNEGRHGPYVTVRANNVSLSQQDLVDVLVSVKTLGNQATQGALVKRSINGRESVDFIGPSEEAIAKVKAIYEGSAEARTALAA